MKEKEKMLQGKWYDATDQELVKQRLNAKDLCFDLNQIRPSNLEKRNEIINKLLGYQPDNLELLSPFTCDYGNNIILGKNVFINIGPSCGFYTANHPLDYQTRNQGIEQALPISIGNNVWLGGNVIVLPGVKIGDGCVIGAGSVVTKDIKANSVAAGIPCNVIKKIE